MKRLKITFGNSNERYERGVIQIILSEVKFSERSSTLQNKQKTHKRILPFVTQYRPSVPNLKNILMAKWHVVNNQPVLRKFLKTLSSFRTEKGGH